MSTDTPTPRFFCVYIAAPNDRNGNPRRGWYVHDLADPRNEPTWIEEGYSGRGALVQAIARALLNDPAADYWTCSNVCAREARETGRIDVTPSEYRDARKFPRFGGAK